VSGPLKLGFVPLADAAALIVAQAKGFFAGEGLQVELVREVSWATLRDKLAVGALDGAHMLAPLALASTLGLGGHAAPVTAPFVLNRGGAAVVLSARIGGGADPAAAIRRVVMARREQGSTPLTFAVVFPHSIHAYLLRRWLADAGVDPDRDVAITVAPPSRMADLLEAGVIEGFSAGEPWPAAAQAAGAGRVAARASAVWPNAPDKVLGVREAWATTQPLALAALLRALAAAADWAGAEAHRGELLAVLAAPEHVGLAPERLAAGLQDVRLAGAAVNAPTEADAVWLVRQMSHWGQLQPASDAAAAARRTFRSDLYGSAMRAPSA
jgi:NitT/TauT family transport system ATP-binding protein/nitrate/nitrite transport system substrate-binding protein